jgi:hypothetical protein
MTLGRQTGTLAIHNPSSDLTMQATPHTIDTERYLKCIEVSKRVRWDIDRDVIRGRQFDFSKKFLPDGVSKVDALDFLSDSDKRLLSQVQGRTYANMFGLVERFINAKVLEISRDHWLGDQTALEALVRFSDEELKHQALFRRLEQLMAAGMPRGYAFLPHAEPVATLVLGKSTWAALGLTFQIELFTQAHYEKSIAFDAEMSDLYKDVFLYHWKEESQHAVIDELEWQREDAKLTPKQRDLAVDDFIALVGAIDQLLQMQARADAGYFLSRCGGQFSANEVASLNAGVLKAYRWQYIVSGAEQPRFLKLLTSLITEAQGRRITSAFATMTDEA